MFRCGEVFYIQDSATSKQTSLRTKDETEAKNLLNARDEAQRQTVLNLHLGTGQHGYGRDAQRHHARSRRIASDHRIRQFCAGDTRKSDVAGFMKQDCVLLSQALFFKI